MRFVDTHTHPADEAFGGVSGAEGYVARAMAAGVDRMLVADVDSRERAAMREAVSRFPGVLFPMIGLYPGSVDGNWRDELDLVFSEIMNPSGRKEDGSFVAIGEIGLDYHWSTEFKAEQQEVLRAQFELAAKADLPVNIHLRDATDDFFRILGDCAHLGLRGNLHAFSGSIETFRRIRKLGDWSVGIGGVVTFKNASLPQTVKEIPLDCILLETDSPYMAPTPLRGTRNESANIPLIAAKIAEVKGIDIETVAAVTTANAERLFRI
ncbi:MAG: TatD family hydrolase [Bacteroidales bacterium]|nr:TatD family hydrolase [Bacteroidales bacterium]